MLTDQPYEVVNKVPMTCFPGVLGSKLILVHTPEEWEAFYELLMKQKRVFCDTETSGFNWFKKDRIVGMSFGWGLTHFYIPVRHVDSLTGGIQPNQLDMDVIRPQLQAFFSQTDIETCWHNFRFDAKMYYADGILIKTLVHDTLFLWRLFNENAPAALKSISSGWRDELGRWHKGIVGKDANAKEKEIDFWRGNEAKERRKALSKLVMSMADDMKCEPRYQGVKRNDLKKIIKEELLADHPYAVSGKEDIHYGFIPIHLMVEYAALDTFLTMKVFDHVVRNMDMTGGLVELYRNEIELSYAIFDAEIEGIKCDRSYVAKLSEDFTGKIEDLRKEISHTLGDINLNSGDQLATALIHAGVELDRTTASGKVAVDKKALAKHKKHPAVGKLLEYKQAVKLKTAFFDPLLQKMNDDDRVFPSFNQNVSTGRMSCQGPNMQQIPRGPTVRNCFVVPDPDHIYLLADYSQIEVRLTAHYSQDPLLLDAYRRGQDVHTRTSAQMFGIDYDEMYTIIKEEDKTNPLYSEYKGIRDVGKCFHPDTEVLTRTGWKRILDISLDEEVIQAIPKNGSVELEWTKPTEITSFKHDSEQLVHLQNEGMDLRVTPDHRMLAFTRHGNHRVVTPEELNNQGYWCNAGSLPDGSWAPDERILRLAVATQADGSFKSYLRGVTFGFSKDRKIERLKSLLNDDEYSSCLKSSGVTCFTLNKKISDQVKELLSEDKQFTWKWLDLSPACREIVLDELSFWDAHKASNWKKYSYYNSDKQSIDVIQAIASISNRKSSISSSNNKNFDLSIKNHYYSRGGNLNTVKYEFTDDIACISVPSTFVLVRDKGKPVICGQTLNFGIIYGVSPWGLSEQIPRPLRYAGMSDEEWVQQCEIFIDLYFHAHVGVKRFINKYSRMVKQDGQIVNYFGRVRHLPHANAIKLMDDASLGWMEGRAKRQGVNFLIQSSAGDLFKTAVVRVHKILQGSKSKLINFVHDEIQVYLHKDDIHLVPQLKNAMEDFKFRVPIIAEFAYSASSWGDKKTL